MKGAVLSACLTAGFVLLASAARAEPADCDLFCHLQGYLSTDHMAASQDGATSPPAAQPAKIRQRHVTSTPVKPAPKPVATTTAAPAAAPPARTVAAASSKPSAEAPSPKAAKTAPPVATTAARPSQAPRPTVAVANPHPRPSPAVAEAPKKEAAAAVAAPTPAPLPAPKRPRHVASRSPAPGRNDVPNPIASAALIPGSARLVPAEFQTFGNL